jgi:hypothetical protein
MPTGSANFAVNDYTYPSSLDLTAIAQDLLPNLTEDREGFQLLPVETKDASTIRWEQLDNFVGLQQVRGIGGVPGRVKKTGAKAYQMSPGYYGEYEDIDEEELTLRRELGQFGQPIDLSDLVTEKQMKLLQRQYDRIELIIWTLLATGTFSVQDPNTGRTLHTDQFPIQTYSAGTTWATSATATPLADFSAIQLLQRGHSVSLGAQARAYMNRTTFNNLRTNTNSADLYGRRVTGLATANNLKDINEILTNDDLPTVVIYDGGYLDDSSTFQLYIPNGKVVVIGKRPAGQNVGSYVMTRNVNTPNMAPGQYTFVADNEKPPRSIQVHQGHNGGPIVRYPSAIVAMSV